MSASLLRTSFPWLLPAALASLAGCADAGDGAIAAEPTSSAGTRLSPGGALDFGLFRAVVAAGGVPTPESLDQAGFFAEHAIGTPEAGCSDAVCASATLGVMGNMLSGASCTLVRVALATPIDPAAAPRRPLHVVLVVDEGPATVPAWPRQIAPGLRALVDRLSADDLVSVVAFDERAHEVLRAHRVGDGREAIDLALGALGPGTASNLHDGLRVGFAIAGETSPAEVERRLVVVTAGQPDHGIVSPTRIVDLVRGHGARGIATTIVGVGTSPVAGLLPRLGAIGTGNVYFVDGARAAEEIFTEEIATTLVPVARDVRIRLDAGGAFAVRGAYGVSGARVSAQNGELVVPALFLATRRDGGTSMMGPGLGRRGGGGAILFELAPSGSLDEALDRFEVGEVSVSYLDARTGERIESRSEVRSTYAPGQYPPGGLFSDPDIEKAFVALNAYVGLRMMVTAASEGDGSQALGIAGQLDVNLEDWLARRPDTDIASDRNLVLDLADNVARAAPSVRAASRPPEPRWSD